MSLWELYPAGGPFANPFSEDVPFPTSRKDAKDLVETLFSVRISIADQSIDYKTS